VSSSSRQIASRILMNECCSVVKITSSHTSRNDPGGRVIHAAGSVPLNHDRRKTGEQAGYPTHESLMASDEALLAASRRRIHTYLQDHDDGEGTTMVDELSLKWGKAKSWSLNSAPVIRAKGRCPGLHRLCGSIRTQFRIRRALPHLPRH
jgi:hypothetical protein